MRLAYFLPATAFIFFRSFAMAQGCSDGGLCSMGSLSILQFRFEQLPTDKTHLKKIEEQDVEVKFTKDGKKDTSILVSVGTKDSDKSTGPEVKDEKKDSVPVKGPVEPVKYTFRFPKYQFHFNVHYGSGERGTQIIIPTLEANVQLIRSRLFTQLKVPYSFISGKLGNVNGLSDLTLSFSWIVLNTAKQNLVLSGGVKIPANNSDLRVDSLPLPMPYQTSLGSYDVLLGAKYSYKKWDFLLGYQHAFNANENGFLYYTTDPEHTSRTYFESKAMHRGDDGILRVNRNFKIKRHTVGMGLLFIYHLTEDTYVNAAGMRISAEESDGLTLNLNMAGVFPVGKKMEITFVGGGPVVNRKYRTDGLTRKFVLIPGLRWNIF